MGNNHFNFSPRADPTGTVLTVLGPNFLGLITNYLLWGVQIVQSYYYYKTFRNKDRIGLKIAVGLLFISDAVQSVATAYADWIFMISYYGDIKGAQSQSVWSVYMMPLLDAFTASIVHVVYAHKIWTLLRSPYKFIFTILVIVLSTTQLVAGLGSTLHGFLKVKGGLNDLQQVIKWDSTWLLAASVTDIVILVVMAWKLSTSRTGYRKTDDIITKLILLIVETNFATSVVQLLNAILFLVSPTTPYHAFPTFIAPKVYSISMLVLLNSRHQRASELESFDSEPKSMVHGSSLPSLLTKWTIPNLQKPTALVFSDNPELRSRGLEHKSSHTFSNETSIPGEA